ncbi:MAG: tripartite tricarboxylate transporter TctB family protein [Clostridia bacterium]|jgi:putative tricarboxylic transport membrane protein|nr:tripartite tricarboxylate transporter TctB family protein [Clostridia bacterium]NLS85325.1 tripartite tricarboxylate transporter TctB family protein [Oscillospiraceae bacterium]
MINVVYSSEHWIMPTIVIGILVILLAAIIITEGLARKKKGEAFFKKAGKFFIDKADFVKLFGTLVLFIAYIALVDVIGFTVTSIVFVFLFNLLYTGFSKKAVIMSVVISVVASLTISVLFGIVFNITLPSGMLSLTFTDLGITFY